MPSTTAHSSSASDRSGPSSTCPIGETPQKPTAAAILVLSFATFVRVLVGYHPHSGQDNHHGKMDAYGGDYEAQRHWMELTIHVPLSKWYTYDLTYWGLDYPPLTAYVSWICGHASRVLVGEESVALVDSRGYEDGLHKAYMRGTVLLLDVAVYYTAVWAIAKRLIPRSRWKVRMWLLATALMQPSIILIDHGHFQYNTVSLGLALWAFHFMTLGGRRDERAASSPSSHFRNCVVGSVLFSLSLNFKQMSLYYAPAVFAYLLGRCFQDTSSCFSRERGGGSRTTETTMSLSSTTNTSTTFLWRFVALGMAVIVTFMVQWMPFVIYRSDDTTRSEAILQIVRRLFPFQRGLFEGKVSNIWCALSTKPLRIRERIHNDAQPKLALFVTAFLIMPPCVALFDLGRRWSKEVEEGCGRGRRGSTKEKEDDSLSHLRYLLWGTATTSLAFFLASFQVHEKGILMPVAPLSLLWCHRPVFITWFSLISSWSLWPLIVTDRLHVAYFVTSVVFCCLTMVGKDEMGRMVVLESEPSSSSSWRRFMAKFVLASSSTVAIVLHLAEMIVDVPTSLPDIFPLLWSLVGCACFCWSYLSCCAVLFADNDDCGDDDDGNDDGGGGSGGGGDGDGGGGGGGGEGGKIGRVVDGRSKYDKQKDE